MKPLSYRIPLRKEPEGGWSMRIRTFENAEKLADFHNF